MSDIQRIKKLMMINEQEQQPVTAPVNIKGLISLLLYIHKNDPERIESVEEYSDVEFIDSAYFKNKLIDAIDKNSRLFGLSSKLSYDEYDFIGAFILQNKDKIIQGVKEVSEYTIPRKKTFEIIGEEVYIGKKGDTYRLTESVYNEEYIKTLIENLELMVSDGKFLGEEWYDTWDMEQEIKEIKEITPENENINEQIDLDSYESSFTSEEFVNYVNSEFDLGTLELMRSVIQKRINTLKSMVNATKRTEVKGFRRFD